MKSSHYLLIGLIIVLLSCKKRKEELMPVKQTLTQGKYDRPSKIKFHLPKDSTKFIHKYSYNPQGLVSIIDLYKDNKNGELKLLNKLECYYDDMGNFRNSYYQYIDPEYGVSEFSPRRYTNEYYDYSVWKQITVSNTIRYIYRFLLDGSLDYILSENPNYNQRSTTDSIKFLNGFYGESKSFKYIIYRDKGKNSNGDTTLHGYASLSDTGTYISKKDKVIFHNSDSTLFYTWDYSTLPNRFQPLLWANVIKESPHAADNAVSYFIEMKQLYPNKHLLAVNRGRFFYNTNYEYVTDKEGKVVRVKTIGTLENTVDLIVDITY